MNKCMSDKSFLNRITGYLQRHGKYGEVFIRLSIGFHLIYGTQDNVFSWDRMIEFSNFLDEFGFPFPLASAVISVYAQFICGVLFILGIGVRTAAAIMIFNFIIALTFVHITVGDSYPNMFPALMMLSGSIYLLLNDSKVFNLKSLVSRKSD